MRKFTLPTGDARPLAEYREKQTRDGGHRVPRRHRQASKGPYLRILQSG